MAHEKLALVTGVGPGTGLSIVRRLAVGGYTVAMIARNAERLDTITGEVPGTYAYVADVSDGVQLAQVMDRIEAELGAPHIIVHNAVGSAFGNFMEIAPEVLAANFNTNVMALMHLAQRFSPAMVERGEGAIIVTGNTSALRGRSNFAGFAPTKAAQRILAESIARELGPKGIHVAYIVIDAVIDVPWTRKLHHAKPDEFFIQPDAIADEVWHLLNQSKSAWSFNVEVRPYAEIW